MHFNVEIYKIVCGHISSDYVTFFPIWFVVWSLFKDADDLMIDQNPGNVWRVCNILYW